MHTLLLVCRGFCHSILMALVPGYINWCLSFNWQRLVFLLRCITLPHNLANSHSANYASWCHFWGFNMEAEIFPAGIGRTIRLCYRKNTAPKNQEPLRPCLWWASLFFRTICFCETAQTPSSLIHTSTASLTSKLSQQGKRKPWVRNCPFTPIHTTSSDTREQGHTCILG